MTKERERERKTYLDRLPRRKDKLLPPRAGVDLLAKLGAGLVDPEPLELSGDGGSGSRRGGCYRGRRRRSRRRRRGQRRSTPRQTLRIPVVVEDAGIPRHACRGARPALTATLRPGAGGLGESTAGSGSEDAS